MQEAVLLYLVKGDRVLLGKKKQGFGAGKWNGMGGKMKYGEEPKDAALRETWEECGINVREFRKMGELRFLFPLKPQWNQNVHVFVSGKWDGEPMESDEVKPRWFYIDELPFDEMWQNDPHWLPKILKGETVKATFIFGSDNEKIESMKFGTY